MRCNNLKTKKWLLHLLPLIIFSAFVPLPQTSAVEVASNNPLVTVSADFRILPKPVPPVKHYKPEIAKLNWPKPENKRYLCHRLDGGFSQMVSKVSPIHQ